jgi:hypothetical protein
MAQQRREIGHFSITHLSTRSSTEGSLYEGLVSLLYSPDNGVTWNPSVVSRTTKKTVPI